MITGSVLHAQQTYIDLFKWKLDVTTLKLFAKVQWDTFCKDSFYRLTEKSKFTVFWGWRVRCQKVSGYAESQQARKHICFRLLGRKQVLRSISWRKSSVFFTFQVPQCLPVNQDLPPAGRGHSCGWHYLTACWLLHSRSRVFISCTGQVSCGRLPAVGNKPSG